MNPLRCILKSLTLLLIISAQITFAQNPFIRNQFTADPSARVFGDRVYVFPSHDILANKDRGRIGWFCMEDYHVFSSDNLTDWTDHGVIVEQNKVPWVKRDSYSMWAPDCIFRNGKYYFYFPTTPADTTFGKGFAIGVAVANKPEGPYVPQSEMIRDVHGIDPNVFIDKDGKAYLYWSSRDIFGAQLKDNMLELATDVKVLGELPDKGLKEGPFVFERNGVYYLTYPHVENKTERLEYAIGDNPLGPFKVTGVIMDESPTGCWTNHHSIIQYKNQWYLFYHHNDYSPKFDKARSIRVDSLFFEADGTIRKVKPTLRGVGIVNAKKKIELDRYTAISENASIDLLDSANTFKGWKVRLNAGTWVRFNAVDFGKTKLSKIKLNAASKDGATLQVRVDGVGGKMLGECKVNSPGFTVKNFGLTKFEPGIHDLFVLVKSGAAEVDWISFE